MIGAAFLNIVDQTAPTEPEGLQTTASFSEEKNKKNSARLKPNFSDVLIWDVACCVLS